MALYEFVTVDNQNGPFEVPGEVVETYGNRPHSSDRFVALVKLEDSVVEEESPDKIPVTFEEVDGVGTAMQARLKAEGFRFEEDIRDADIDELVDVKGVGEGTAERIKDFVEE